MMIIMMGWDHFSELLPQTAVLENNDGMIPTGENSWFVYQNSVEILPVLIQ
jgi:hypothetical protein